MKKIVFILLLFILSQQTYAFNRGSCSSEVDSIIRFGNAILYTATDSALTSFNLALEKATTCNDSLGITKSTTYIGLCHYLKNNYEQASNYYFQALLIAEKHHFTKDEGILNNNLGALYFDIQEYKKSKKYYEQSMQIMTELKDITWLARITGNIAGVYFMNQEFDKSIEALNQSIRLAIATKNYPSVGGALANLAMVHTSLGNVAAAFTAYDRGIFLLDSVGDKRGACITLVEKGKAQDRQKKHEEAQKTLLLALSKALKIKHKESIVKSNNALSKNAEYLGNITAALAYHKQYATWKDSLLTEEKFNSIEELNKKYQTEKKEEEITFLTSESKLKDLVVEKNKREKKYLFLLATLLLVIIILIVFQLKQKQKLNIELVRKNEVIEKSLKEREVLIREVHHRVKNNLQIVSSMLNIQASSIADEKVKEAILESRKRVQSMAIVHQKLYKTDQVGLVEIKDYLEHILSEIESFYDYEGERNIEIKTNIDSFELNIDTVIPLGLIITELVSNAYKHAFLALQNGVITVELSKKENVCILQVKDNGIGLKEIPSNTSSFGIKLIKSLSKSLASEVKWSNNNGTTANLSFNL